MPYVESSRARRLESSQNVATDSWMGQTALESISQCPDLSILHQLIAELLLLRGARKTLENESNKQLLELVVDWDHGGSERGADVLESSFSFSDFTECFQFAQLARRVISFE